MTAHSDEHAFERRLDVVHGHVLHLQARLEQIEQRLGAGPILSPPPPAPASVAPRLAPPPVHPAYGPARVESRPSEDHHGDATHGPERVLAIAGGSALLLGLALFVGYAIEQDWLPPMVRFAGAVILSALLTMAAWPVARRGYEAVAGAIGGAGLGAYFAAWLVGRHVHELVSAPQTFIALGLGAAACLFVAERLRLRLMAVLATLAACATPLLVSTGGEHLHELMLYMLLVVAGLVGLDLRARWPELPTIGLMATWMLGARWAAAHLDASSGPTLMLWAVIVMLASAGSAWRVVRDAVESTERSHAHARLAVGGLATWIAAFASFGLTPPLGAATLLLAAWHACLGVILRRRDASSGVAELFIGLGWLQAVIAAPLWLTGVTLAWWWLGMSVVAAVLPPALLPRIRGAMLLVPTVATIAVCLIAAQASWSLPLGLVAAGVLLVAGLWTREEDEAPAGWMALAAALGWTAVVIVCGPEQLIARLGGSLLPVLAIGSWASARPSAQRVGLATGALVLGLGGVVVAVLGYEALELGEAAPRVVLAGPLVGLASLAAILIARVRAVARDMPEAPKISFETLGLLTAVGFGLTGMLGVATMVGDAVTVGQAGYSLVIAATGLGLIVFGLRLDRSTWRQLGLVALGMAALKIVTVDLAHAAVAWRALSFVGLGAIMIAGAFAYGRQRRALDPAR